MKKTLLITFALLLGLTACGAVEAKPIPTTETATPTQIFIITATLPPTSTFLPTDTSLPVLPTATPVPVEGQTTSKLNVRSAPSDASELLGEVEIFAKVQIIGKDPNSQWWLIYFPEGTKQTGWVAGKFVQVAEGRDVPVVDVNAAPPAPTSNPDQSTSIAEASPQAGVPTATFAPTAALVPIPDDGDSAANPAVNIVLADSDVPILQHQSGLSFPEGDQNDWVQFALKGAAGEEQRVAVVITCSGMGRIGTELLQNNVSLQKWGDMNCGEPHQLLLYLYVGAPYQLHLYPLPGGGTTQAFSYHLTVKLAQ